MSENNDSKNINISLPDDFINRMKSLPGFSFEEYLNSFNDEASKAVHVNTKFIDLNTFESTFGDLFSKLPYGENTYASALEKPGTHPLFHSGIIYSQDPGAMMPVSSLDINGDGLLILDMCAAPGGKTSQVTIKAGFRSIIVANEINRGRNQILKSNLERMGYDNVIVTSCSSDEIAAYYPGMFDVILVDAPCSGEGMFRKYPEAVSEWSVQNVKMCSERQKEIVRNAYQALKPGGIMLYSTCTYAPEENEDIVSLLATEYHMSVLPLNDEIIAHSAPPLKEGCGRRFYPHISYGEGQFLCILKKEGEPVPSLSYNHKLKKLSKPELDMIAKTFDGNDRVMPGGDISYFASGDNVIAVNNSLFDDYGNLPIDISGKRFARLFVTAGSFENKRFVPNHHFFKSFGKLFTNKYDLFDDPDIAKYLRGEEITGPFDKGYGVITYLGAPVGGFKAVNGRLKNHYPKGLRNNN